MSDEIIAKLEKAVLDMDEDLGRTAAQEAVDSGMDAFQAVDKGLVKAMKKIADQYDNEEIYLPQVLACADAFYAAFEILRPHIIEGTETAGHKVVIGVVEGDIHDIGKNLVKTMIEANGFNCIDKGRDVPIEDYVEEVVNSNPGFLAMSTLMTPTMKNMKRVIEDLKEEDARDSLKIMIGGGPIDQEFAQEIEADFYGDDESDAVKWLQEKS